MPIEITDIDGGLGNIIRGYGAITGDEYLSQIKEHLHQDKSTFERYKYSLADYTAVESISMSHEDIRQVAHECRVAMIYNPDAVVAILADDPHIYELARVWESQVMDVGWETMVFSEKEAALTWLKNRVIERFGFQPVIK